ncbi:hypothetical protein Ga0100231_001180 [Opitutaceae bacterium TAV4]|nr:hypothetical protein Ga0100230_011615 [Opitutaceae bacterium TAV3]RRK01447.1 hypothetical protein Ga0100231_001180 [Opitutaceae bacterium TAV4]
MDTFCPCKAGKIWRMNPNKKYSFPPLELLSWSKLPADGIDTEADHQRTMDDLVRILGEFNVAVSPVKIHSGPVISCYEIIPAPGVRFEEIASLDKNIALGMDIQSVRVIRWPVPDQSVRVLHRPVPNKATVVIEIPNRKCTLFPVTLRDIIESEDWASTQAEIPIALGKNIAGKPLISDLTQMPHLLIAGATGTGKAVCINSLITSIVYHKTPDDLRFVMVDNTNWDLSLFNALPHMLMPVVTECPKAISVLNWLLSEMERRYQIFAEVGVRNISSFNHRKEHAKTGFPIADLLPAPLGEEQIPDRLPYIVTIINELADLMLVVPAEIETGIARLAQLGRAAGIHLIAATQRPSVKILTSVIKANLPSRIAFQVASQVDSRTILDSNGAEALIGYGDMLFSSPGSSQLVRAQNAAISEEDTLSVVEYLKRNGPPQYTTDLM